MWFKFAPGATNITVEQQQFSIEYSVGPTNYFQAPSHFASKILAFKGYAAVEKPEGAPADKLKIDAKKEDEEAGLVMQVQELREEIKSNNTDVKFELNEIRKNLNYILYTLLSGLGAGLIATITILLNKG